MRNLVVIFLLTSFAIGQENLAVQPPPKLNLWFMMASPNAKDKKVYQEFSNAMPEHYSKLDQLFKSNTGKNENLENEWQMICQAMRTDIQKARIIINNISKGSDARIEGAEWFRTLMSLVVKLESKGMKTFQAKIKLDQLIVEKNKSMKDQKFYKKRYKRNLAFFDERIAYAKEYKNSKNKSEWLQSFKMANGNLDFKNMIKQSRNFAYNDSVAIKEYEKAFSKAKKEDEALLFNEEEEHLSAWEIKEDNFSNFKNLLSNWKTVYRERLSKAKKVYTHWFSVSSWVFDDTLFRNTQYMKGWTWQNFYQKYIGTVSGYEADAMRQTFN